MPRYLPARRLAILGLLLVATLISTSQIYFHTFLDESENLYFGYWMSRGGVLYNDMFSHHFPFPYWWIALVTTLFGRSITAVRLSWVLLEMLGFAAAAACSSAPLAVALAAVLWSLVGHLYFGNLLIAYSFKCIGLMVLLAGGIFGAHTGSHTTSRAAVAGCFGAIAALTDPTTIYIVSLVACVTWCQSTWRRGILVLLPTALGIAGMLLWLAASRNLAAFVDFAFRFNRDVYSVFGRAGASGARAMLPYDGILWQLASGLSIADPRWWHWVPDTALSAPDGLHDRWVLTGLAYRLYVAGLTLSLAWRGDYCRAAGIYGFAVLALALRGEEGFHSSTFALGAILSGAILVTDELPYACQSMQGTNWRLALRCSATVLLATLALSVTVALWPQRSSLRYAGNFGYYEGIGRDVTRWTCGRPDVRVSHWPSDLLVNWFANRLPISRYAYVLPWTIGISAKELTDSLLRLPSVVTVDLDGSIGPFRNAEYLSPLLRILDQRFVAVQHGVFVSPELARCIAQPATSR